MLVLYFSETVRASTLNTTQITLQDDPLSPSTNGSYRLSEGYSLYGDHTTITVVLSDFDLNELKRLEPLGTSENTTIISLTSSAIQDMNMNFLREVGTTDAVGVTSYTGDTTPPELVSYSLDFDSGEIALTFSETVRASSLVAAEFTLQNTQNSTESFFTSLNLTTSETASSNEVSITLQISLDDLNTLKQLTDVATNDSTTFLSLTSEAIQDMFNNTVETVNTSSALSV